MQVTTGSDGSLDTHACQSKDNYYTLMQRQEVQVRRSVAACKGKGISWLFHVDDDELLYFREPFSRLAAEMPSEVSCIVLVNIEAVPKNLSPECVFEDIEVFTQHKMLAYRNGKSAGKVERYWVMVGDTALMSPPPPPPLPPERFWIVRKIPTPWFVRNPISAFGWSPNIIGVSCGNFSSMYFT